jgi:hemolysin activation/secretion protein
MKKVVFLSVVASALVFGADVPPPPPPENSSIIEKKLQELESNQEPQTAKIDKLKIEKNTKGKSEVHLKQIKFLLRNLKIVGNTVFPKEEIIKIVKPYVGKYITAKELKEIAEKITDLYHKAGYLTSKCIIPPQKVVNGTVKLQIIEDRLAKIIIIGKNAIYYNQNIFMRYLYDLQGKVLNVKELNYRLKLLTYLPVTKITPILKKIKNGYTVLILKITEAKQKNYVSIDNSGSVYTGVYRINIGGNINNIRGVSDSLNINVLTVKNPKYLGAVSLSYVTPYGDEGARYIFGYSDMYYQLNPDEVGTDTVIYKGGSKTLSVSYTKPLLVRTLKTAQLSYKLGVEKKDVISQTVLNSDGSLLIDGEDKTFVLFAGLDLLKADRYFKDYTAINKVSLTIKHALEGVFGSMTSEDLKRKESDTTFPITGPIKYGGDLDPSFTKIYYSFSRTQKLPKDYTLKLSLSGDYTKHRIPQAYEYAGHDWGYSYSASLSKNIKGINTSLSVSQSVVYDYDENGTLSSESNPPGIGLSLSKTYKNWYLKLSYSTSFATWDYNNKNLRFTLKYSW